MIFYIIKVTNSNFTCCSLLAPPARSYKNQIVLRPVGESWEDIDWDGDEHRTCANQELGMFCHLLYPRMVTVVGR
jgi:hypothetical protein